ncbi:MAG: AMP-binding protein [Christensenellaceae bacterium]|jgi:fatty-acyl-CoA synthase|nr:AMP-binding protein [Christensenellaceae bacterium]
MDKLLEITLGDTLESIAKKFPMRQAVKYIEVDYERTYYEFNRDADTFSKGLLGMGLKKGDHVAVWATNYPQWLILLFAAAKIGVVLVTVNTNYKAHELEYLLKNSDSKALFICDGLNDIDCEKTVYELCPELKTSKPGHLESVRLPLLKLVCSFDNHYDGMYHWSQIPQFGVLVSEAEYRAVKQSLHADDVINIQYTSGTTGFPKGVMLTHKNIVNNGMQIGDCMKFTHKDRLCIPVPFFHCFGLVLGIMASVTHATAMIPLLFYTPMKVMHTIEYEKCTAVHGVPTMFINILEHRDFNKYDYSTLRTGIMAGSPCPEPVMRQVMEQMNMKEITITYGQTEASPACTMTTVDDDLDHKVTTVGKTLEFQESKIVDPESGVDLPVGTPGEFCVRGYNVMKGYYKMPIETAKAIDSDGWLHTGDIAVKKSDGYYKITGRIKDMIIRGGENIFPKEIEDFIYTHPSVKDVQIVAIPSKRYGEETFAFVIRKKDTTVTEKELRDYVLNHLARYKAPSYIHFIDSFPLTASGKIQKFKLREMAKEILNLSGESISFVDIEGS